MRAETELWMCLDNGQHLHVVKGTIVCHNSRLATVLESARWSMPNYVYVNTVHHRS